MSSNMQQDLLIKQSTKHSNLFHNMKNTQHVDEDSSGLVTSSLTDELLDGFSDSEMSESQHIMLG